MSMLPWDEFKAFKKAEFDERRRRNAAASDASGWTQHTEHHWSRELCGHRLDYWPSRKRFRWKGQTHTGDVNGFIKNRET